MTKYPTPLFESGVFHFTTVFSHVFSYRPANAGNPLITTLRYAQGQRILLLFHTVKIHSGRPTSRRLHVRACGFPPGNHLENNGKDGLVYVQHNA